MVNVHNEVETGIGIQVSDGGKNDMRDVVSLSSDYESETLKTDGEDSEDDMEDDDDNDTIRYPHFKPSEMGKEFKFKLGMEFDSIQQFKNAVREYSLLHRHDVRFVKNDKVRCRVVCCRNNCEWLMFVSKVRGSMTYQLKTFYSKHTCGVNGEIMRPPTGMKAIDSPRIHVRPGHPRKLRRVAADEPLRRNQVKKTNVGTQCSACGAYGHNKRTCRS